MLRHPATSEEIAVWKKIFKAYRGRLRPNRKSGEEIAARLRTLYPVVRIFEARALSVVTDNVEKNECFKEKLPAGKNPAPAAFFVQNTGAGERLYRERGRLPENSGIFVGIDLTTGYFCVEGSETLYDELIAFRGLDERDLTNFYSVAEYVSAAKKYGVALP